MRLLTMQTANVIPIITLRTPGVTSHTEPFGSLMIQPVKPFECCKSQNLLKQL